MKFKDLLNKVSQGIIITLIILFFLNLSTKLRFTPKGFGFIRSFPELHFLKELLIIVILSLLIIFVYSKIKKRYFPQLTNPFGQLNEKYFLVFIFIFSLLVNYLGAYFVLEGIPHTPDDFSYLFQAKIFSTGRLYAPAPVSEDHFRHIFDVIKDGRWYSRYFPGFPLILTLGVLIKMPWIINPIFGSLSLVLIYFLGREIYNREIAMCAASLGLFSPFFLFYNSTFMSETTSLFFILLFILFFSKMIKRDNNRYPILLGSCLGMVFIIRTYTALLVSLPFISYLFCLFLKKNKNIFKKVCLFSVGFIIFLLFLLWYNWELTGNPLTLPYTQETVLFGLFGLDYAKHDYPGFHRSPINTWGNCGFNDRMHTPIKGLLNTDRSFVLLNRELFGWPVSLLFIFVPFLFRRKNKWDILLLFLFLSIVVGHFFFWLGLLKYWFPILPALLFLTARGIVKTPLLLQKIYIPKKVGQRFTIIFVVICFLYSFSFYFPYILKVGRNLCYVNNKIFKAVRNNNIHNAIIFMSCKSAHSDYIQYDYLKYFPEFSLKYFSILALEASGFLKNPPDLQGDILYARDLGNRNILLMEHYSERRYFIYEYDFNCETENLYEIHRD